MDWLLDLSDTNALQRPRRELVPVDTSKGEQHQPSSRAVNPNGKTPAIVDTDGPSGKEAVHFQFAVSSGLEYAANRFRREAERHYAVSSTCPPGSD
ncbi:hypothetical protein [Bradyrhizobium sp. S3.2.12]|uniref:hypothetical protein n=1 Tax=Bradyrhizobium sp. S3.2.12 TaxID=3156387 RepID=UPI0033933B66